MFPSKSEIFNSITIPFYSLNSCCVNLVLEPAGDSGHESWHSALVAEYIEFILHYLSFELEYSQQLSVGFHYPYVFPPGIWSMWPGRSFRCLVSWLWLVMWPPETSGLLLFVKIMLIFSMKTQTSQRAEPQQGPGSWQSQGMHPQGGGDGSDTTNVGCSWGHIPGAVWMQGPHRTLQEELNCCSRAWGDSWSATKKWECSCLPAQLGAPPVPSRDAISAPELWWGNFSRF